MESIRRNIKKATAFSLSVLCLAVFIVHIFKPGGRFHYNVSKNVVNAEIDGYRSFSKKYVDEIRCCFNDIISPEIEVPNANKMLKYIEYTLHSEWKFTVDVKAPLETDCFNQSESKWDFAPTFVKIYGEIHPDLVEHYRRCTLDYFQILNPNIQTHEEFEHAFRLQFKHDIRDWSNKDYVKKMKQIHGKSLGVYEFYEYVDQKTKEKDS